MRILIKTAILSILAVNALATEFRIEENTPSGELRLLKVLSGSVEVSVYITGEPENEDSFKQGDMYLQVQDISGSWWVHAPNSFDEIDALGFVEGSYLLVGLRSAAGAATTVLNIESRESYSIGQGIGEIIRDGPNEGLIRLNGQYGYDSEGRYWYTSVVDLRGRVTEFDSGGDACLPVSHIVRYGGDTSQLRQSLDFCVGVTR